LHMGYCFELLTSEFSANHIRRTFEQLEAKLSGGWPCWAISNHDVERVVTRWGGSTPPAHLANLLTALVCSLRGSVCVYQGEELGLTQADVPFESLRDPYGLAFWPNFKGRDGSRTPMPWDDTEHGGFSRTTPWLPMPSSHRLACVSAQDADPHSALNGFRALMRWRKEQPALRWGSIRFLDTDDPVLAFVRTWNEHAVVAAFNLSHAPTAGHVDELEHCTALKVPSLRSGEMLGSEVRLPGYSALFARLNCL
jgi:alpha-glucosidase